MKLKLLLLLFALLIAAPAAQASFPVKRATASTTTASAETDSNTKVLYSPAAAGAKSQGVALLLWIFLGLLAAHRWYLGSPWYWNLLFIVTGGGLLVWAIIDLVDIITGNYPAKGGFKSEFW